MTKVVDFCLLLIFLFAYFAAKFEEIEVKIPRTMELNVPSKGVIFTDSEYLQMELIILNKFNWNVGFPTAAHFMDYLSVDAITQTDLCNNAFLCCMSLDSAKKIVEKYTTYFLEISLQGLIWISLHKQCLTNFISTISWMMSQKRL